MSAFPTQARAVIVGGGIIGCSVAYHLARLGWTDTVLLERAKLTSGSTFHAAGLVGQLRSNANVTRIWPSITVSVPACTSTGLTKPTSSITPLSASC